MKDRLPYLMGLVLIIGTSLVLGYRHKAFRGNVPPRDVSASGSPATGPNAPWLSFSHSHYDGGVMRRSFPHERLTAGHSFPFVNRTQHTVTITKVAEGSPHLHLGYPKGPIRPGESGEVNFGLALEDISGPFRVRAFLFLNDDERNRIDLVFSSFILDPVVVLPPQLHFGEISAGRPASKTLSVRVPLLPEEESNSGVMQCSTQDPHVQSRILTAETLHLPLAIRRRSMAGVPDLPWFRSVRIFKVEVSVVAGNLDGEVDEELVLSFLNGRKAISVPVHAAGGPSPPVAPFSGD